MGYSRAEKVATHNRIVKIAAARFRERGLDGISVADLMKEAGLTVGGFYKHFETRDQLVIEAMSVALTDYNLFDGATRSLPQLIAEYLSEQHRDSPGTGCAMGALLGEMGRASVGARRIFTDQLESSLSAAASALMKENSDHARERSLLFVCTLLGAINLARAVDDHNLSREILRTVGEQLTREPMKLDILLGRSGHDAG